MGTYWFMLIFCVGFVLLAMIVIPWINIYIIIETIRERKIKLKITYKPVEKFKMSMQLTGALLVFALVAVFLGNESVNYLKDFPYVIQGEYSSKEGFIEYVDDLGKRYAHEVEVEGEMFNSNKIKRKHVGRYISFEYLPHTKLIVSYEFNE